MNEADARKLVSDFAVAVAYRGDAARVAAGDKIIAAITASQSEPLGILRRGDGGSFRLTWPENLLPIYAMAEGEHKLYAAAPAQPQPTLRDELQQKCVDWGVYWRASDAHGVDLTHEQALELLRDALGVEVEIKAQSPR